MSRVASLFSRRVPLRIWLPIVITCAVAGFVASTFRAIPSTPHIPRSEGQGQAPVIASPAGYRPSPSPLTKWTFPHQSVALLSVVSKNPRMSGVSATCSGDEGYAPSSEGRPCRPLGGPGLSPSTNSPTTSQGTFKTPFRRTQKHSSHWSRVFTVPMNSRPLDQPKQFRDFARWV